MKNKFFKRIMSLVLVVVMAVSTMIVSSVSASAETTNVTYKFDVHTAGSLGKSNNKISIKVNGDNGSTDWHDVGYIANERTDSASFDDIDVGTIKSITVKKVLYDGWYPEYINVTKGDKTTTIYGGRWIDDKNEEFTLSVTDRAAKVTVKTSDVEYAGTDWGVYVQLYDDSVKYLSSEEINLSDIHPDSNAFERNDLATFYILVPDNFVSVSSIDFRLIAPFFTYIADKNWCLDYVDVTLDGETQRFYDPDKKYGYCINYENRGVHTLKPAPYIYKVTVNTSDVKNAGTDDDIHLYTYDSENKSIRLFNLDNSENNFERDETDVFYITSSTKIDKIKMHKSSSDDWHLEYVQLDRLDISKGEETVVESVRYTFNKWINSNDEYSPTSKEVLPFPDTTYKFEFSTAGSDGETKNDFMIKVNGTEGSTAWHEINENVTQGKNKKSEFNCGNVGSIESVTLKVLGDDKWYPEKIKITKGTETTTIYGGRWIDSEETKLKKSDAVYELKIKTGNQSFAGTDCPVYATLVDAYAGLSLKVNLSDIYPKSNAFEADEESTFYIYPYWDFTKLMYVNIESLSIGTASPNWYIKELSAKQVQGKNIGDGFTVKAEQWDVNDNIMSFGRESGAVGTFEVEIKTADKFQAGTDGNIYLQLVGQDGNRFSSRVCIDDYMETYTSGNNYERGDVDKCRITFDISHLKEGLGQLTGIKIYNTGGGAGPDWKVDYIKVTEILPDGTKGKTYQFTVNDWINDYKLEAEKPYYCTNVKIS